MADDDNLGVTFDYISPEGLKSQRRVIPVPASLRFGTAPYHRTPQWLMDGFDIDKQADQTFALTDVANWLPLSEPGG